MPSTSRRPSTGVSKVVSAGNSGRPKLPPPMPKKNVAQHIMPPSELYRLDQDREDKTSARSPQSRATRTVAAPWDDASTLPSLPHPPRRLPIGSTSPRGSPDIPQFSISESVNNFLSRRPSINRTHDARPSLKIVASPLPQSEFGLRSAVTPPRPAKSPRRPPVSSSTTPRRSDSHSPPRPSLMLSPDTTESAPSYRSRDSSGGHSNASTAKQAVQSPVQGQLTFREIDTSPRPLLSEVEKAKKWDDLLELSAQAGGTLHLGESGLLSDSIRFSSFSEAS